MRNRIGLTALAHQLHLDPDGVLEDEFLTLLDESVLCLSIVQVIPGAAGDTVTFHIGEVVNRRCRPAGATGVSQAITARADNSVKREMGMGLPDGEAYVIANMQLVWPAREYLPGYIDALERGWSPDNLRHEVGAEQLAKIRADADAFLAQRINRDGSGPPITLPDGTVAPRFPSYDRWLWDGEFCGVVGFRWQPGTNELPPYVLGHIGFGVVPWKRRRGYATAGLGLVLAEIPRGQFDYVELTTDVTNVASQRVIEANGGVRVETFFKPAAYGGAESYRYRIYLE